MLNTLRIVIVITAIASVSSFLACSKDAPEAPAAATSSESKPARRLGSCELVTAAEMSKIFGKALTAEQIDGTTGQGACQYSPAEGMMPRVELNIEWGAAEAQAIAAGLLGRAEKGLANRFEGIGDSAVSIGPMLYIRRGEDLISLMIFGADDVAVAARSIYAIATPRLPAIDPAASAASAASRAEASQAVADAVGKFAPDGSGLGGAADFLKALGSLSGDSVVAGLPVDPRSKEANVAAAASRGSAVPLEKAERIPLIPGLTLTGAVSSADGDYEPILEVSGVRPDSYDVVFSADVPGVGKHRPIAVTRRVRNDDQRAARTMRDWFGEGDDEEYPGTVPHLSSAMLDDLRGSGATPITLVTSNAALFAVGGLRTLTGTIKRVERDTVAIDVLVNGTLEKLPTIHALGTVSDRTTASATIELWVLDDRVNPIVLKWRDERGHSRVVKIEYPVASRAAELERALENGETVEVYGIYFDFASATIRPQSAPVLEEIAGILRRHDNWSLDLAGFTDNIGKDTDNLELSRRRTAAVKTELSTRFGIAADRLHTTGYGEGSPKATNDTPEGRAQNRRVEVTRRRSS
jgi:outer membrane protein OmpA-like peptidoglycan-associated protein